MTLFASLSVLLQPWRGYASPSRGLWINWGIPGKYISKMFVTETKLILHNYLLLNRIQDGDQHFQRLRCVRVLLLLLDLR